MAISRSNDTPESWTAGVELFSGRPDPRWTLTQTWARRVEALWDALEPVERAAPPPPPLGYRGCLTCDPAGRRWQAYRGVVTLTSKYGRDVRDDPTRGFERLVLESAPPGVLPERIVELAGLSSDTSPP
jgi:hypothetical protein